jgi:hypothetical protein
MVKKILDWFNKKSQPPPSLPPLKEDDPQNSPALKKFLQSTRLGFIEWHDGLGYDLEALRLLDGEELARVEAMLIAQINCDWRQAQALGALLPSPTAFEALRGCLKSPNLEARCEAAQVLMEKGLLENVDGMLAETLPLTRIGSGLSQALYLAQKYPSPAVLDTLWSCVLDGNDDIRVICAGKLYQLYGKSQVDFDWPQRDLFLRFKSSSRSERLKALSDLKKAVGLGG